MLDVRRQTPIRISEYRAREPTTPENRRGLDDSIAVRLAARRVALRMSLSCTERQHSSRSEATLPAWLLSFSPQHSAEVSGRLRRGAVDADGTNVELSALRLPGELPVPFAACTAARGPGAIRQPD
jgi:hypothetical protein